MTTPSTTTVRPAKARHTDFASSAQAAKSNISARDLKKLVTICDNAPEPNEALLKAARVYCAK